MLSRSLEVNESVVHEQNIGLFPLHDDSIQKPVELFSKLTENELSWLKSINHEQLPYGHPLKFVLKDFGIRRELNNEYVDDIARQAYSTGAILGGIILERKLRLSDEDSEVFTRYNSDNYEHIALSIANDLPWNFGINKPEAYLKGQNDKFHKVHNLSRYLNSPEAMIFFGFYNAAWLSQNKELTDKFKDQAIEDLVILGARDTFEFYAQVYNEDVPEKENSFIYNPNIHFLKNESEKVIPDSFVPFLSLNATDFKTPLDMAKRYGGKRLQGGYYGQSRLTGEEISSLWSNNIPAGIKLNKVTSFVSCYVMPDAGRSNKVSQAGYQTTIKTYILNDMDQLVLKDSEGHLFILKEPFIVRSNYAKDIDSPVQLIALLRKNQTLPLMQINELSAEDNLQLSNIEKDLRVNKRGRYLGNLLLGGNVAKAHVVKLDKYLKDHSLLENISLGKIILGAKSLKKKKH
jgi:flagellar assembly factor FliW